MASTRKIYNGLYIVGNDHNNAPINQHKVHKNDISRATICYIYFLVHDPKKLNKIFIPGYNDNLSTS